jgi:signal transduction histidine kinase/CheY-like chemotaxis protein
MINPFSIIPFLSFIINIVLASIVLGLNPYSKTNRSYSIFAYNFAFWALLNFLEWNIQSPQILQFFAYIEPFAWLPTTFLVIRFIYVFVKRPQDPAYQIIKINVIIWLAISAFTGCLIEGFTHAYWGNLVIVTNFYFAAVLMTSTIPALWGFYILFKASITTQDSTFRAHLRYLTIGTIIMYVLVISDSILKVTLLRNDQLPYIASFLLIIQSVFVFIAIIRHRFLSIDLRDAASHIFYNVNEGVILLDLNRCISNMNESAQKFFGINNIETVNVQNLFGQKYSYDENIENLEITFLNNGEKKTGLLSQSNLYVQGTLIGKLVIIHDITFKREEEQKLVMLEKQVQQLHASRLEALGKLAGGIAHDFNNVLSVITGSATLLRMSLFDKDKKVLSHAESIIKTAQDASVLTRKMLTFAHQNISEFVAFDLHETINDVVTMLQHTIDKRINVQTSLSAQNHILFGDRVQIQNLLLNIAINACDAMPNGGLLNFSTRNEVLSNEFVKSYNNDAQAGNYVIVDIEDNGSGMTEEIKKRIFEPFFTTKQMEKGTGLGLATAYGTSLSHKGFISVDSELGAGTVFHVFFPVLQDTQLKKNDTVSEIKYGKGKILLVDDDEKIRNTTSEMLETIGYTLINCSNGEDAIRTFKETNCDVKLVILDVILPLMNGVQCAEHLRKINPKIKIIFISGYLGKLSSSETTTISTAINSSKFIYKPFTIEQLSHTVKEMIEGHL